MQGCQHPILTRPWGTGCLLSRLPSLARDSETLANFSEFRFRNDLNMETWFFGKLSGVYFRNCFFQGLRLQGHFPQELHFNGNHNIFLCASHNIKKQTKKIFFFFGILVIMLFLLVLCPFIRLLPVPSVAKIKSPLFSSLINLLSSYMLS